MTNLRTLGLLVFAYRRGRNARDIRNLGRMKSAYIVLAFCTATAIASPAQTSIPLFSFDGTTNGGDPGPLIQAGDGNFYGTTDGGGTNNVGTVFQITPGGTLTTLYNFCSLPNCADGAFPSGLMQAADGNFYGTTGGGGNSSGRGTLFEITAGGILTTLYSFCSQPSCSDGGNPNGGLLQASNGKFYGTTAGGGICEYWCGTVFEITPGGTLTTLYSFCGLSNCSDGAYPVAGLIQATNGDLYGTTDSGGTAGYGTVFGITPEGTLTTLHSFCVQTNCPDGSGPSGLIQAIDGNLYGTTFGGGGAAGCGTIFGVTPEGSLTTLYTFCSQPDYTDGAEPGGLIQSSDGNFYGTTSVGPTTNHGTVFEFSAAGMLTTLYDFCSLRNCVDGALPGGLLQAEDGNFYGVTARGGASASKSSQGAGTVFTFGPSSVALSHTSLSFGDEPLYLSSPAKVVMLTNASPITLQVGGISASGSFAVSANTCGATLLGSKKCKVSITFTPTTFGLQSGTLSFTDSGAKSPQTVTLSGTGIAQTTLTPTSLTFPETKVGDTSGAKNVTLKNNLPTSLTGMSYSTTGPFAVAASTCTTTLDSKKSCTISVTFSPTATDGASGTLTVSDSANNSPQTVSLSGSGD